MSFLGTVVFTGNVHKSPCPEHSRNAAALSLWALPGPLAQLPWVFSVSVMACDFAKMSPLRLHCHVAFAISMKISLSLFFFQPLSLIWHSAEPLYREYLCAYFGQKPYKHIITKLSHCTTLKFRLIISKGRKEEITHLFPTYLSPSWKCDKIMQIFKGFRNV